MNDGQGLTPEAASVLKQSVELARRKKHCQTTPFHVVLTLLGSPSGLLQQALKSQHSKSSHPLQWKAMELCFNVALNRLPTTLQNNFFYLEQPPFSNSLLAVLKRARGRVQQKIKMVELEHLIISILNDPGVSRVMQQAGVSSPTISDTIQQGRKYEVFMSFRGEDTRASFTSHLYASLQNAGIIVFKDDESLPRGQSISDSLLLAIQQSRISVIVFSRNYADSRWCLKELEKIMECRRTIGQVVVPVFYDVDPSQVRHQTGEFGNAFENLMNRMSLDLNSSGEMEMMPNNETNLQGKRWREALRDAAGISGL